MIYSDNYFYHVYNRGAYRLDIFRSEFHYSYCLSLLQKYKKKYNVGIIAYCFMPNHYHFLLRQHEGGSISRFIQTTFNAYVQKFNRLEHRIGTIFQGTAKGIQVEDEEYICRLICYIHFNPVAAGLAASPDLWKYSDYNEWIGNREFMFDGKDLLPEYFETPQNYCGSMLNYQNNEIPQSLKGHLFE